MLAGRPAQKKIFIRLYTKLGITIVIAKIELFPYLCISLNQENRMSLLKHKTWTYKEYYQLNDDKRYELIEGELIEIPAPTPNHQEILLELSLLLRNYVKTRKSGKIYLAPCDVIFSDINTLQPDIFYISKDKLQIIQKNGIFGSPDLIVEIVSSNPDKDKVDKFRIYEKHQVQEYWLVDPIKESIEIFVLTKDQFISYSNVQNKAKVKSRLFSDIDISYSDISQKSDLI